MLFQIRNNSTQLKATETNYVSLRESDTCKKSSNLKLVLWKIVLLVSVKACVSIKLYYVHTCAYNKHIYITISKSMNLMIH